MLDRTSTREIILLTAETLFAEKGIDDVSVRQINLAAGQKNSSAAQYHFGTKDDLVVSIFDYRMEAINHRRSQLVDEICNVGREKDLRALVGAVVYPLAELMTVKRDANNYVRFVAQVNNHPRYDKISRSRGRVGESLKRVMDFMVRSLKDIPDDVFKQRFGMMLRQVFSELAAYQRQHLFKRHKSLKELDFLIGNLIDINTAALSAPIQYAKKAQLSKRRKIQHK